MAKKNEIVKKLKRESIVTFESIKQFDEDGNEYWLARPLARILEYADWRNFQNVISKAKLSCENSNHVVADHFVDVTEMIELAKGAVRNVD